MGFKPIGARPCRILIVEDHQDTVRALAQLLRRMGHAVVTQHSIADALRTANDADARGESFDVLLCDLILPDGSGLSLPGLLPNVRCIALTGLAYPQDKAASSAAGFIVHLSKPVAVDDLRMAIEHACRLSDNGAEGVA